MWFHQGSRERDKTPEKEMSVRERREEMPERVERAEVERPVERVFAPQVVEPMVEISAPDRSLNEAIENAMRAVRTDTGMSRTTTHRDSVG